MNIAQLNNLVSFILKLPRPIYAHYGITHRCNLDCKMCKVKEDFFEKELSISEVELLAKKIAKLGILYISIGGGEPLLREDIVEAVDIFVKNGIKIRLLTNGVLLNRQLLHNLKNAGLKDISISLDTLDRKKFEYITGYDLLYKVIDSIKLVNEVLQRGIWLLNCVVSRLNFKEIPQILDFAKSNNFLVSLIPVEDPEGKFLFLKQDYKEIDNFCDILFGKRRNIFNSEYFLKYLCSYLKGEFKNFSCYAGRLYFSISPNGGFNICHKYHIKYDPLKRRFNKGLRANCPGCLRPCWREIDFAFDNPKYLFRTLIFYLLWAGRYCI